MSQSPPPPILSPQITASEALEILATYESVTDTELLTVPIRKWL